MMRSQSAATSPVLSIFGLHDGELVAAETRDAVGAARAAPASRLDKLADEIVAGRVAERVVDVLEAVEVEIVERRARAAAARLGECAVEAVVEERAVGEAGQRVMEGEVLSLRLARLQLRRGAPQPPHQQRDDASDEEHCDAERRGRLRKHAAARALRLPDEVAERPCRTFFAAG